MRSVAIHGESNRTKITEKQYLDHLRALYRKFFKDKKQYAKYEHEYLSGMKSLYDKVFSHVTSRIGDRISAINKEKDAAIDSLEKQKEAAEEAYQSEIDAIEKANRAREQALDLQQKQYNLERLMNQRSILLYSEDKGMHYVTDTSEARKAKDEVDSAKSEARISELEGLIKESNKYYDSLIEQTNAYYDSMISLLEDQKEKFEELRDLMDEAQMSALLKELGINEDALLSGSTDEFNRLKEAYMGILADLNRGNGDVLSALSELSGMSALPSHLDETASYVDGLAASAQRLGENVAAIDASGTAQSLDGVAQSSADAAEKVQGVTDALNELSNDVSNYRLPPINADDFMASFADDGEIMKSLRGFTQRFQSICAEILGIWNQSLSDAFGTGGSNPLDGGAAAAGNSKYDALFSPLLSAVNNCKSVMQDKLKECLGAFTDFQEDLSGVIGVGGSGGQEQSVGAEKKGAGTSGGEKKPEGESGAGTIVGAIQEGGALIEQYLNGEEESWSSSFTDASGFIHNTAAGIVACIESMAGSIVSACAAAINAINMMKQAEKGDGSSPTPPAYGKSGHGHAALGRAYAGGINGTKTDEEDAVVSEYGQREMVVFPNGKTVITDEPTAMDMPKGTVVYNEEQTDAILKNKITQTGTAHAAGTDEGWFTGADGHRYRPIQPGDRAWELQKAFEPLLKKLDENPGYLAANAMIEHNRQMEKVVSRLNHANVVANTKNVPPNITIGDINISCPGVTSDEVAKQVGEKVNRMFSGLHLDALQLSMMKR